ncbi:MAG: L,D-transpeptidase [Burkholderiaceae bacterium]
MAATALGALLCLSAPARADIVVTISKSQQRLAVMVNGAEAYRWPVSTGAPRHQTPAGVFRPARLERHWYSRQYSLTPMPWSMFFHRGYAVHGTMEAYNLGRAVSHGCVRLRPDNAAVLYSLVRRQGLTNTKFVVLNGPLPETRPMPPNGVPMAVANAAATPAEHFAKAASDSDDDETAKTGHDLSARHAIADRDSKPRPRTRLASADSYRTSVGSDEAQILREREAWLRGLDRKYGITR